MPYNIHQWTTLAESHARREGIPPALVMAVIDVESGGNPHAWRDEPDRTTGIDEGSRGLMQVLFSTARALGYSGEPGARNTLSGLFDPDVNVRLGAKLCGQLWRQYSGDVARVASAYNGGNRPDLGFGSRLTRERTVCLERAPDGRCTRTFTAAAGSFGNQPHVDKVTAAYAKWSTLLTPIEPGGVIFSEPHGVDVPGAQPATVPEGTTRAGCAPIFAFMLALAGLFQGVM